MMRKWLRLMTLAAGALAVPAIAAPVTDCPLRDRPFSLESPLIDVLLSPAAKAVLSRELPPGTLDRMPPNFAGTTSPTFAAILTVRNAAGFIGAPEAALQQIGAGLATLPVTPADRVARCARYDNDKPAFTLPAGKPRVLLFEKMTGFRDGPSVDAAHAMFVDMAKRLGWALVSTDKGGAIDPAILKQFDLLVWNNVSGDVLTLTQRRALEAYVTRGGGFLAVHGSAGDPVYFWDWYADTLIGARFVGHPRDPQFQDAKVVIDDARKNPIGRDLAPGWTMKDEWYSFRASPRLSGATIIATLDESTYKPQGMMGQKLSMGADHPIAWTRCVGSGRSFYTAIGHRPEGYSEPHMVALIEQAARWAAGNGETTCAAGREVLARR